MIRVSVTPENNSSSDQQAIVSLGDCNSHQTGNISTTSSKANPSI